MYAIIRTGGKQYRVAKDDVISVEKLSGEAGATVEFGEVLMIGDGAAAAVGDPLVAGAKVMAKVLEQTRADKILVFKKKRRKRYKVKNGHRQPYTQIKIDAVSVAKKKAAPKKKAEPKAKAKAAAADSE